MLKPLALTLFAAGYFASSAVAQVENKIADLNRQALDAYQALDIDGARAKLERAIKLAQRAKQSGPTVAQSYLALGLVYVAGINDQEQGLAAFVNAICIQRDVQLDPLLSTPGVKQVFLQAQKDARSGACGPESESASPPPPAPPPAAPPPAAPPPAPPRTAAAPAREPAEAAPEATPPVTGRHAAELEGTEPECPPGMHCGGAADQRSRAHSGPARFFINAQLVGGFALLRSGMEADSKPPALVSNPASPSDVFVMQDDRYVFNGTSPWVPDADSFDDFEADGVPRGRTTLSTNCAADGKTSGPVAAGVTDKNGRPYTTLEPSKYCVRVATPGLVPTLALRANLGYFVTDSFAISVPLRFQFSAGLGTLSHMLLGLRGELMLSRMPAAAGTAWSWFFGATYGQIQARPSAPAGSKVLGPFATSGPFGAHTGVNFRVRVSRNFGFIIAPEFDVQFPALMLNGDLAAGIETGF